MNIVGDTNNYNLYSYISVKFIFKLKFVSFKILKVKKHLWNNIKIYFSIVEILEVRRNLL